LALSQKQDRFKVSSMCATLVTDVTLVACSSLVFYFLLAELSCMSLILVKCAASHHVRQRVLVEDATHVTKLKEGAKLTHASTVNQETIKH
jgi:hypothetical protein